MSDQLEVPGISSSLTFDLSVWTSNVTKAGEDAQRVGALVETSLAKASEIGTASAMSLAAGVESALAKTVAETREQTSIYGTVVATGFDAASTSAIESTNSLAAGIDAALENVVSETRGKAATVNKSLAAIGDVEPVNVIRWEEGLRSFAGIAGMANPQLGQLVSGFTAVEGASEAAGLSMSTAAVGIGAVVGSLFAAKEAFSFALDGIKLAADMEQVNIAFTTMIGNATVAKHTLADLQNFADTTPFHFDEVAAAGRQLLAMGIAAKDLTPTLRRLGDVSSGLGQPLGDMAYSLGKVRSEGRAMTVDLNEFSRRGVPIFSELAKVLHVSEDEVRGLAESGKIGFAEVEAAIESMTAAGGRFHDLTKKQAASIRGELSTLSDAWDHVKRSAGEAFLDGGAAGDGIETLTTKVNALTPAADRFGAALRHAFESAIGPATHTLEIASFIADKLSGQEGTGTVSGSANPSVTRGVDQTSDPKALLAVAANLSSARKTMAANIRSVDSIWDGVNQGGLTGTQDVTDKVKEKLDKSYADAGKTSTVDAADALIAKLTAKQNAGATLSPDEVNQLRQAIAAVGKEVDGFRTTITATKTDLQATQREFDIDPMRAKMNTNRIRASELDPHVALMQKALDDSRQALTAVADTLAPGRVAALPKPVTAPAASPASPAAPAAPAASLTAGSTTGTVGRATPKDDAAASAERALRDRQDAYVQSLRNQDKLHEADLAALSYRFGDRDKKASTPDEKLAIAKEYEAEKAAIEKRYADESQRAKDAATKENAEKSKHAAEQVAEFQRKALVDGLIAAGRETDAQRQSIVDRWKRTLDGINDPKVLAEARKASVAELAAFDKRQADRAERDEAKSRPATSLGDATPRPDLSRSSPITLAMPGESPAARNRRFQANQSARTLSQLNKRDDLFGLSDHEQAQRDRVMDFSGVPAFGPSANSPIGASAMPANGPRARAVVERNSTPVQSAGNAAGKMPPITVNSPGFDVVKLANALAVAVKPVIEKEVNALATRLRAEQFARGSAAGI